MRARDRQRAAVAWGRDLLVVQRLRDTRTLVQSLLEPGVQLGGHTAQAQSIQQGQGQDDARGDGQPEQVGLVVGRGDPGRSVIVPEPPRSAR